MKMHRPGRVVTLVKQTESSGHKVYGFAYEIDVNDAAKTFEYLNMREKCGYTLNEIEFYPCDDDEKEADEEGAEIRMQKTLTCLCYFANPENEYYSPVTSMQHMAEHIHRSLGPSGTNKEYLFNLVDTLERLAVAKMNGNSSASRQPHDILKHDAHLFELVALVRQLDDENASVLKSMSLATSASASSSSSTSFMLVNVPNSSQQF